MNYNSLNELSEDFAEFLVLGLDEDIFINAALGSYEAYSQAVAIDPVDYQGHLARAGAIRVLRSQLIGEGWRSVNDRNFAWVYSPSGNLRFGVSSAVNVGLPGQQPRTLNPKGRVFTDAVSQNLQINLPGVINLPIRQDEETQCETWILLFQHIETETINGTIIELSRPMYRSVGSSRRLEWVDRLFFPMIPHNEGGDIIEQDNVDDNDDNNDVIDFEIRSISSED